MCNPYQEMKSIISFEAAKSAAKLIAKLNELKYLDLRQINKKSYGNPTVG